MYYYEIRSVDELVGEEGILRIPEYAIEVFVEDEPRREAITTALNLLQKGENVLIVGLAGTGKTALMAIILKKLMDLGRRVAMILEGATVISREHEEKGVVLFYDDIPRMRTEALVSIFKNGVKGVIATARIEELSHIERKIGYRFSDYFNVIKVPLMSAQHLNEMLKRYVAREGITIPDKEAIDVVVEKAQGLPVYIWQVVRELRILKKPLTMDFAKLIPEGMLEYVDDILWRVLDEHDERYEILLTLLIISDMKRYAIHQDLYNYVFLIAKERRVKRELGIEDALYSTLFDRITRYLARESATYTFRLPHDSWADVLKGKSSGPMSGEISRVNTIYPPNKRRELVIEAIRRAWNESVSNAEDVRKQSFIEFVELNFGRDLIKELLTAVPEAKEVKEVKEVMEEEVSPKPVLKKPPIDRIIRIDLPKDDAITKAVEIINKAVSEGNLEILDSAMAIIRNSSLVEARFLRGLAYYLKGNLFEAEREFKKAAKFFLPARLGKALVDIARGNYKSALKEMEEYLKKRPNDYFVSELYTKLKFGIKPLIKLL